MVLVRPHPDFPHRHGGGHAPGSGEGGGSGAGCGGRLNLLLSCAGWQQDPWVDRLPRLLEPMGVIAHRAQTGGEAKRVIESTPIHIAVVDLGLPLDGQSSPEHEGGPRLLELLGRLASPPPTVVVKRSRSLRDDAREIGAALRAGAFAVVERPRSITDLEVMLEVLRRCLHRHYHGRWPGSTV
ncbi:MAG: hypothetical protein JNL50_01450 [Phycisphaerae bacterium]|nr:hypothetical protein [Phycisphaerae bacterium]